MYVNIDLEIEMDTTTAIFVYVYTRISKFYWAYTIYYDLFHLMSIYRTSKQHQTTESCR